MKKIVSLIVLSLICVGFFVGYIVLSNYNDEQEKIKNEAENQEITVNNIDKSTVTGFSYYFENERINFTLENNKWLLSNNKDFPLVQEEISTLVSSFCNMVAEHSLVAGADLTEYGLENPSNTVEIITATDKYTYFVGDLNIHLDCYYLRGTSTDIVYLIKSDLVEPLSSGLYDYIENDVIATLEATDIAHINVSDSNKSVSFTPTADDVGNLTWSVSENGAEYLPCNTEAVNALVDSICSLEVKGTHTFAPTDEELQNFGLIEDAVTLTVIYNEKVEVSADTSTSSAGSVTKESSYNLTVGNTTEDTLCAYAIVDTSKLVSLIDSSCADMIKSATLSSYVAG